MDTENINIKPENEGAENKREKNSKAKKAAGSAARFAGAVGLGVAGAMAADAMNLAGEDAADVAAAAHDLHEDAPEPEPTPGDEIVEEPEEFDPNDIMIEEGDEIILEGEMANPIEEAAGGDELAMIDELEPITGDDHFDTADNLAMIDDEPEEPAFDPEGQLMAGEDDEPGIWDGSETMDDPESYLADGGAELGEPDILDDILNA